MERVVTCDCVCLDVFPTVGFYKLLQILITFWRDFFFFFLIYLFILGFAGSLLLCRFFSSCGKRGYFLVVMHRLLVAEASLVTEHRL